MKYFDNLYGDEQTESSLRGRNRSFLNARCTLVSSLYFYNSERFNSENYLLKFLNLGDFLINFINFAISWIFTFLHSLNGHMSFLFSF